MNEGNTQHEKCYITGKNHAKHELIVGSSIRKNLTDFIRRDHPGFSDDSYLSLKALQDYRRKYLESVIESEMGELDRVEREVVDAMSKHELISENINKEIEKLKFGERLADIVASFGGSWTFIIFFGGVLFTWIVVNSVFLASKPFDPYPYILLNLILSCLAALQAPVIMMSQNRKEAKDRIRGEHDYKVNLKAELEIRLLHEKMDHLMVSQNQRIMELQQVQMDFLEQAFNRGKKAQ